MADMYRYVIIDGVAINQLVTGAACLRALNFDEFWSIFMAVSLLKDHWTFGRPILGGETCKAAKRCKKQVQNIRKMIQEMSPPHFHMLYSMFVNIFDSRSQLSMIDRHPARFLGLPNVLMHSFRAAYTAEDCTCPATLAYARPAPCFTIHKSHIDHIES